MTVWSHRAEGRPGWRRAAQVALWLGLPVLGLAYQVTAKQTAIDLGAQAFGDGWIRAVATSPWAWAMVAVDVLSFVAWMLVLAEMKLSSAFPLSAAGYGLVVVCGWTVFGEPVRVSQVVGSLLILAGMWLIGREPRPEAVGPC